MAKHVKMKLAAQAATIGESTPPYPKDKQKL
jgi:hypothetical protein